MSKHIIEEKFEFLVDKINNRCKLTILKILKMVLKEYNEVSKDSVFGIIVAINEHNLGYSGKVIHSFIYKQIIFFKLHELWFLFARRSIWFSMQ